MSNYSGTELINKISERYWLDKLKNPQNLMLFSFANLNTQSRDDVNTVAVPCSSHILPLLNKVSQNNEEGKYAILLTALKITLFKYTGFRDIIIAATSSRADCHSLFVRSPVFYRNVIDDGEPVIDLINRVSAELCEIGEHAESDILSVLEKFSLLKLGNETDLFQVGFKLNDDSSLLERCPVLFQLQTSGDNLLLVIRHTSDSKFNAFVAYLGQYYLDIVGQVLQKNVNSKISVLNLLSKSDKDKILFDFNHSTVKVDSHKTVIQLFEEQVDKTPDILAVAFADTRMTYRELNEKVNQVANYLLEEFEIRPGDIVGIKLERSEQIVVAMLGIIKSGAAYLPIDLSYPLNRLDYILEDAECKVFLTEHQFISEISERWRGPVIELSKAHSTDFLNPPHKNDPTDAIYAIYTSGSTGKPKGVLQTHLCLSTLIQWQVNCGEFTKGLKVLQWSSISFDASIHEILFALLSGGAVQMVHEEIRTDLYKLGNFIKEEGIEIFWQAASALNILFEISEDVRAAKSIKHIVSTAEQLKLGPALRKYLFEKPDVSLHNFYGPSETHVVTANRVSDLSIVYQSIGKPLPGSAVYILSEENMEPVPIGKPGEVYMAGACLAKGYLNQQELTTSKFIMHSFDDDQTTDSVVLYKSGDIGVWWPDGTLQYLGRLDDQVKVRGYRIELGEIESCLLSYEYLQEAVVLASKDKDDNNFLSAYIISSLPVDVQLLRDHLLNYIPEFMLPTYFTQIERFPLTPTGKIDKKALPSPERLIDKKNHVPPRNEVETKLILIWKEILGRDAIGIRDNFFELGGHSLKATRLISRIYKDLHVQITLRDIFQRPTVEDIAGIINSKVATRYETIEPLEERPYYEVSYAQKRIWISDQVERNSASYNMADAFFFKGKLDKDALQASFLALMRRHEVLRTSFIVVDHQPKQVIRDISSLDFMITWQDIRNDQDTILKVRELVKAEAATPFNLEQAPLMRVKLLQVEDDGYVFLFTVHHIISDAWSKEILVNEVITLYNAYADGMQKTWPALTIQYKDFVAWQHKQLSGDNLVKLRNFWFNEFKDGVPVLQFPTDHPRPAIKTFGAATVGFNLNDKLSLKLHDISQKNGVTLFMTLVTAVKILLYRYTHQEEIVIGTPVSIRNHEYLENQIGLYLNNLPLKNTIRINDTFGELLQTVRRNTLAAFEHQDYPFDMMVEDLVQKRDVSRSPLFDVVVVLGNSRFVEQSSEEKREMAELNVSSFDSGLRTSNVDMRIVFGESAGSIYGYMEYNVDLFKQETIKLFVDHFLVVVDAFTKDQNVTVGDIGIHNAHDMKSPSQFESVFNFKF
jgi:amino acid adenylation domain-containing protein